MEAAAELNAVMKENPRKARTSCRKGARQMVAEAVSAEEPTLKAQAVEGLPEDDGESSRSMELWEIPDSDDEGMEHFL